MKFRLYAAESEWTAKNAALETHLGIPDDAGTDRYAVVSQVSNPEHVDYGKFIMPAAEEGTWSCADEFDEANLVPFDPAWTPIE